MLNNLIYRRQFLLAKQKVTELENWTVTQLNGFFLHVHPDLEMTIVNDNIRTLILLGCLFDPQHHAMTNKDILQYLLSSKNSFDNLIYTLKPYPGIYALFYHSTECFYLIQDALSLRETYYLRNDNQVVCGSQPNLLARYSDPVVENASDPELLDFMQHHLPHVRRGRLWVGDETCFKDIKHLMPNHYLDINARIVKRYWPNIKLEHLDLNEAVELAGNYLKGTLKAVTYRYNVMMAVTSGIDSRSLLAASRDVQNRIYYFINKHAHLSEESTDIKIPKQIFKKINIPFHIHNVEGSIPEDFRNIFLNNTWKADDLLLPAIYNVYFKNHQDKVNLLGVGEIGREYYDDPPKDLDGYYLAWCLKYKKSKYAAKQCDKWLKETSESAKSCNIEIMQMFLWEALLGNWGAVGNSESDIAIEEFDPYDSHYIYEIMLSVKKGKDDIFKGLFNELWPELLEFPFNPPETKKESIKEWLIHTGLYKLLKKMQYRLERWQFYRLI